MGFFGTYQFNGTGWSEADPNEPASVEPVLWVDVHDSDFTTVRYAPAGPGAGVAYLGMTPRIYFDNGDASAPTDVDRESRGLVAWWASLHAEASDADKQAKQLQIAAFLAADEDPFDEDPSGEDPDDDADVFVEIKTAQFLAAMGLPLPQDLEALDE